MDFVVLAVPISFHVAFDSLCFKNHPISFHKSPLGSLERDTLHFSLGVNGDCTVEASDPRDLGSKSGVVELSKG